MAAVAGLSAAPPTFNVSAPKWTKLAECTTDGGINIRKTPSTTAPRMVYDEAKITDYDVPLAYYGYWSTGKTGGTIQPVTFAGVGEVVGEQPGWLEINKLGPKEESNGWVSAKYCRTFAPTPITFPSKPFVDNLVWLTAPGNTADGVYAIFCTIDEMNSTAEFYFGRLVNGLIVCPYRLECMDITMNPDQKVGIVRETNYYAFNYNDKVIDENYQVVMSKLPGDVLLDIIEKAQPAPEAVIYCYGPENYWGIAN